MSPYRWVRAISYVYLLVPVTLFSLGWLRRPVGIAIALLLAWTLWRLWGSGEEPGWSPAAHDIALVVAVTGAWVLLSGVGGYAFQNWDHHWRNAVFHDLIDYGWPVVYSAPERGPIRALVYNVGYWLPAAMAGRYFGWQAANGLLFLWTWLGAALVGLQLVRRFGRWSAILLLIGFGGLDALGTLVFSPEPYPGLWPPISHLEIWSGELQYSSFTTQLFWVFHQALPAWLCFVLLWNERKREEAPLLWSLCFFFAPLPAIGWAPFVFVETARRLLDRSMRLAQRLRSLFFAGAPAAIVVAGVTGVYYAANTAGQKWSLSQVAVGPWLLFILLEGGLLWLLLLWRGPMDARLLLTGGLLVCIPLLRIGSGRDFVMRASIPILFYLMLRTGDILFGGGRSLRVAQPSGENVDAVQSVAGALEAGTARRRSSGTWRRAALVGVLAVGTLTPLYEINRSVYRTLQYYLMPGTQSVRPDTPTLHLTPDVRPEAEHQGLLEADELRTLSQLSDETSRNFVGDVRKSWFYTYLADR